ncbi:MAG: hypothetical protein US68_C0014G0003 [Candidatus Shapirobacteria bacterium GW2011_GWE1_38_10]|uniref:Homeodomain phBC6A51-type domain-containing protein n=1 Tax=Candidatus Shapirobacteria bacterium GW2011_GWE1_38_10 TaxID=1618488 RepID=A0A0G0IEQ7_9BACT|nr:MAG: hypothetical protein US68_C0014G0003 [Candidatus Shapirobacteria bacterium GW2011_GWE1_38_10]
MSTTIQKRQKEERTALIENLKRMPIIQIACEKTGVSRATFYRWKNSNNKFSHQVDEALKESVEMVNDMAEAKLIASIKEGNMTALIYWLKHRHRAYSNKVELSGSLTHVSGEISEEYKELISKALRIALPEESEVTDEL